MTSFIFTPKRVSYTDINIFKKKMKKRGAAEKREEIWVKKNGWKSLVILTRNGGNGLTCISRSTPVCSWKDVFGGASFFEPTNYNYNYSYCKFYTEVSARKLGAVLWEFEQYFDHTLNMYLGVNNQHQRARHHHHYNSGVDHGLPDHHPASAGSLRRHIAASLMRHHQSAERNKHALQPLSPASYGSSLEIAPYNPAAAPESSVKLRGRIGESGYNFKTSTELLKVLNRIWVLEEQKVSNVSLVKTLKSELDHARARIKELLRDQQSNRRAVDQLMKQISEDSLARKNKEHNRLDAALQSVRGELEDERRLRKRSESLHRKLAKELFEVKVALELEKEKKSGQLLEELCDEFAQGIREYARQARIVKQKSDKDWPAATDHDNLILHMSESWLDERVQIEDRDKQGSTAQRPSVVDTLGHEIETFLSARQLVDVRTKDTLSPSDAKDSCLRRRSLESIPEAVTGPQDSSLSESHGEEVRKAGPRTHEEQEDFASSVRRKVQNPPSVQMSDPQNTPQEIDAKIMSTGESMPTEITMLQKSDVYDSIKEQRKKAYDEEGHGSNSRTVDKLISELLLSEGPEYEYKEIASSNKAMRRNPSPIREWMTSMASPDPKRSESSSKQAVNNSKSKARLQERKSKGQHSRLKILKGSS